jgi:hypothetical protein
MRGQSIGVQVAFASFDGRYKVEGKEVDLGASNKFIVEASRMDVMRNVKLAA